MRLILTVLLMCATACASARHSYNRQELKYNIHENKWEYAEQNEKLKYNYHESKWEYAR